MTRSCRQNNGINRSNNVSYYKTRSSAKVLKTTDINKSSNINDDISLSPTNCKSPELFINESLNNTNQQQSDIDIVVLDFNDVNLTIWPLDRPIPAEFTFRGFHEDVTYQYT